ncbi:Rrf2 family transcriptional regulator [Advenella sp. S44]|uniref:Rrf2 family transcriptional regulator n=1 Tax=Advenella sp. S44 TaxID=1982755 RepID=UPI000C29946B|nr:Rrf2 family transcriptional regulator [Advenella sp. S44]PJX20423.1 Rrf2 family transcriptional regulator [Advenella sp. S44]
MRLTQYTDYALRVLIFLGSRNEGLSSIAEIARAYDISQNHLMKVVQHLGQLGYIDTLRGRKGGIRLGMRTDKIVIGQLVRHTEGDFDLVDCSSCTITGPCRLPSVLREATQAFLAVLDKYTLKDLLGKRSELRDLLGLATSELPLRQVSVRGLH